MKTLGCAFFLGWFASCLCIACDREYTVSFPDSPRVDRVRVGFTKLQSRNKLVGVKVSSTYLCDSDDSGDGGDDTVFSYELPVIDGDGNEGYHFQKKSNVQYNAGACCLSLLNLFRIHECFDDSVKHFGGFMPLKFYENSLFPDIPVIRTPEGGSFLVVVKLFGQRVTVPDEAEDVLIELMGSLVPMHKPDKYNGKVITILILRDGRINVKGVSPEGETFSIMELDSERRQIDPNLARLKRLIL